MRLVDGGNMRKINPPLLLKRYGARALIRDVAKRSRKAEHQLVVSGHGSHFSASEKSFVSPCSRWRSAALESRRLAVGRDEANRVLLVVDAPRRDA